jgi:hypothetical protein
VPGTMCLNAPVERVGPGVDTEAGTDHDGDAPRATGADDASAR